MDIINKILTEFTNKKGGINTKKIKMVGNEKYLKALIDATNFLPNDIHLRFRFNYIKDGLINTPKKCKECGKVLLDVKKTFCSSVCSNINVGEIEKMKHTWNTKSDDDINNIQLKRRKTNLKKYGVDIASKTPEVIEKNRLSHLTNWGDYAMRTNEVLTKRNDTLIERYGGIGMASEELFSKMKEIHPNLHGFP